MKKLLLGAILAFSMVGCTDSTSDSVTGSAVESFEINTTSAIGWHVKLDGTVIDSYTNGYEKIFKYVKGSKQFSEFDIRATGPDEHIWNIEKIEGKKFFLIFTTEKCTLDFTTDKVVIREFVNTKDNYSDIKYEVGSKDFSKWTY